MTDKNSYQLLNNFRQPEKKQCFIRIILGALAVSLITISLFLLFYTAVSFSLSHNSEISLLEFFHYLIHKNSKFWKMLFFQCITLSAIIELTITQKKSTIYLPIIGGLLIGIILTLWYKWQTRIVIRNITDFANAIDYSRSASIKVLFICLIIAIFLTIWLLNIFKKHFQAA